MISNRKHIQQFLTYGLGSISGAAINFILIPLYLSQYTAAEYGVINILLLFITFVSLFVSAGMMSAVQSQYFKLDCDERKILMGTVLIWYGLIFILFQIVILGTSGSLASIFFGTDQYAGLILLTPVIVLLTLLVDIPLNVFRLREKAKAFVVISLLRLLLEIFFKYLFIIEFERGVSGYFEGTLASLFIINTTAYVIIWAGHIRLKCSKTLLRTLLKISTPFIITGFSIWSLNSVDRLMLNFLQSESATGIYSLGARFAQIFNIVFYKPISTFLPAIIFTFLQTHTESENKRFFRRIMNSLIFFGSIASAIIIICSIGIIDVLDYYLDIDPAYIEAKVVIPVLVLANLLYSLCIPAGYVALHISKTKIAAIVGLLAAIINAILNYFLIKMAGVQGAAVATLLAYGFYVLGVYALLQKRYFVNYKILGSASQLLMLTLAIILLEKINFPNTVLEFCIKLLSIVTFMIAVSFYPNKIASKESMVSLRDRLFRLKPAK